MSAQQSSGRPRTVQAHTGLACSIAKRYRRAVSHLKREDLEQEAAIGLLKAIEKFDPERGAAFSTCAGWWIRQQVGRAVANQERAIRLPVHVLAKRFAAGDLKREGFASLDKPIGPDQNSTLHDLIGGESEDPIARLDAESESAELAEALARLTEKEQFVLRRRYFDEKSQPEIAAELGRTRQRVQQIEAKALAKLFKRLG